MPLEDSLKNLIVNEYGSLRQFAPYTGLPYSTIASILRRGIDNCNAQNLKAICSPLGISTASLLDGKIEKLPQDENELSHKETIDIVDYLIKLNNSDEYLVLDGKELEESEKDYMKDMVEILVDVMRTRRMRKEKENKK